jgi:hypothetical protein
MWRKQFAVSRHTGLSNLLVAALTMKTLAMSVRRSKNTQFINKIGSGALRGAAHGYYQGVCLKNAVQFRGTRINVTPSRPMKTRLSLRLLTRNSQILKHVTWRSSAPNITEIGQEIWTVQVEICTIITLLEHHFVKNCCTDFFLNAVGNFDADSKVTRRDVPKGAGFGGSTPPPPTEIPKL